MRMDYHMHSAFSGDGHSSIEEMCIAAQEKGFTHIAITDHHDIGDQKFEIKDLGAYSMELDRCRALFPGLNVARGMEMDYRPQSWEQMKRLPGRYALDFALLSLHIIDGVDPYRPEYFENRSRQESYSLYLQRLADMIRYTEGPWVLSHLTYVSKFAPFDEPVMRYADYPDELDEVLRLAVAKGYGLEVNTSGINNNAGLLPGCDTLRRYRELGGEIVTVGSDAHSAANIGRSTGDATAAVRDAGFKYLAAYNDLKPCFIKIN